MNFLKYYRLYKSSKKKRFIFGLSHFTNAALTHVSTWNTFDVIKQAHGNCGALILGQIPTRQCQNDLLKILPAESLIVSCNETFELSGCGSLLDVIPPHEYRQWGMNHHHLPMSDFSGGSNAPESFHFIQALKRIKKTHDQGKTVYIHCKAGRSRSGLLMALTQVITDSDFQNEFIRGNPIDKENIDDNRLRNYLKNAVQHEKKQRPQVSVGKAKIDLGINILKDYIINELQPKPLNKENILMSKIAQRSWFKKLWFLAHRNPKHFDKIKVLIEDFNRYLIKNKLHYNRHTSPLYIFQQVLLDLGDVEISQFIVDIFHTLETEDKIRNTKLYDAQVKFYDSLKQHKDKPALYQSGLNLRSSLILAKLGESEKERILTISQCFLNDPNENNTRKYDQLIRQCNTGKYVTNRNLSLSLKIFGLLVLAASIVSIAIVFPAFAIPAISIGIRSLIGLVGAICIVLGGFCQKNNKKRQYEDEIIKFKKSVSENLLAQDNNNSEDMSSSSSSLQEETSSELSI